jgi:hypothetical protein
MIGFFIGTACLLGFIATMRHARHDYARAHGMGHGWHGWHGGHCHGYGYGARHQDDRGRSRSGRGVDFLHDVFRELDTTPGQEKVVREAASHLWSRAREAKSAVREARRGFARAVREESFDEVALGEATAKLEEATEAMRKAIIDALAQVHGVLDERQRKMFADVIEAGGGFGYFQGSRSSHWGRNDRYEGGDDGSRSPWSHRSHRSHRSHYEERP